MKSLLFRVALGALVVAGLLGIAGFAGAAQDFGQLLENQQESHSQQNFGITDPIDASSQESISEDDATDDPLQLVTLAKQLKAQVVAVVPEAPNVDMMALWPNDEDPEWIIACNEEGTGEVGLIRIDLSDGSTETIVASGLDSCDPVHRTAWGTIVFAEENGSDGRLFELIDPLDTTDVDIVGDTPMNGTNPDNIVLRDALGNTSYEGVGVYPNGVVYYGDERRPLDGDPGGAYYKFVPDTAYDVGDGEIDDLSDSPLVDGTVYGLRLGKRSGNTDYGQGTNVGLGTWIELSSEGDFPDLPALAADLSLTGYYRPEDLAIDEAALAGGDVRWCGNNTGNEETDQYYGDTICLTDGSLEDAMDLSSTPEVQYLVIGNPELAMMDNIAYQPGRGNWVLHEDGDQVQGNNDLWDCMDDGMDDNLLSDSCIRIGTLNDLEAEWTGGVFNADGDRFFVSVQHNVSGDGVVLEITGWK